MKIMSRHIIESRNGERKDYGLAIASYEIESDGRVRNLEIKRFREEEEGVEYVDGGVCFESVGRHEWKIETIEKI